MLQVSFTDLAAVVKKFFKEFQFSAKKCVIASRPGALEHFRFDRVFLNLLINSNF